MYSPFRCEEMPETTDRIDGRTAIMDIISHRNGNYWPFIFFFFLSFFIIYLTVKSFLTDIDFFFFFFFFYENSLSPSLSLSLSLSPSPSPSPSLSLSPVLIQYKTKALSVLYKPD